MQKTPDEIKKGLECCHITACGDCPFMTPNIECREIFADALTYIQQLEAERDALLDIVRDEGDCELCKHLHIQETDCEAADYFCGECDKAECVCSKCTNVNPQWEWRGAKEDA